MSKLIAITGNAGKTTFSYLLAQKLCRNGSRVMLVSTDSYTPTVPYLMKLDKNQRKSLGRILSLAVIDEKSILANMVSFKNENIGLLSYALGESQHTYPAILDKNIEDLFENLKTLVDYIIVDTNTCQNAIDKYAISHCDSQICITTANYKGLAYRQNMTDDSVCHIIYNDSPFNPFEDIRQTYKHHVKYVMDYCKSLQCIYNGVLLDDVVCPPKYDKLLRQIEKDVILIEQ